MYPERATHIAAAADPLLHVLHKQGVITTTTACALHLRMEQQVTTLTVFRSHQSPHPIAGTSVLVQSVYGLFRDVWRMLGQDAVVCLLPGAASLAAVGSIREAQHWLDSLSIATPAPESDSVHTEAAPAPPTTTMVAPLHEALQPLSTPFDAIGLLYGGKAKPGVRVVAFRRDEFGTCVILDGPQSHQVPVPSPEIEREAMVPLLDEAATHGVQAVCVDVDSQQTYAVSIPTMLSLVARQAIPRDEKPILNQVITSVHPLIADVASHARSWSTQGDSFRRFYGGVLWVICAIFFGIVTWLFYALGVLPVYDTVRSFPGLAALDGPNHSMVLALLGASITISVAHLIAWIPTILEVLGLTFGAISWWFKVMCGAGVFDVICNVWYYYRLFLPADLDRHHPLIAVALHGCYLVIALVFGILAALFLEILWILLLVMLIALFPAFAWSVEAGLRGMGVNTVRMVWSLLKIGVSWRSEWAEQSAQFGNLPTTYVYVQSAPSRTRHLLIGAVAVVGCMVLIALVAEVVGPWVGSFLAHSMTP